MTRSRLTRIRIAAATCAIALAVCAPGASSQQQPAVNGDGWSDAVDGLQGRLVLTRIDSDGRPQLRIDLDLANEREALGPIEIPWDEPPSRNLQLSLENDAGTAIVDPQIPAGNEIHSLPYRLSIPKGAVIRIPASGRALEYQADGQVWLRPFVFVKWALPVDRSRLYLRGTVRPGATDGTTSGATRRGPLPLPRVRLPLS